MQLPLSTGVTEAPIEFVTYDDTWPANFEAERTVLEKILAPRLAGTIEHIESTAVPVRVLWRFN